MNSTEIFNYSKTIVPGGVHSPVRSFKGLHTTPRFIQSAHGAKFTDIEGNDYIDFCMSFGPLILGHAHPKVHTQLQEALTRGWSYGACEPYSVDLAQFILDRLDFAEQIRFVNSGTEAVMTALRLARGFTKRDKIIKFNGCYHGHVDSMLIKAGSGLAGVGEATSAGIPASIAQDTIVLELGDQKAVEYAFEKYKDEIACIIIEPLPANNGLLIQEESFLNFLRDITEKNNSLLIFDEVISGFRVSFGGMSEITGIRPDIATYGKIIGGGLPVGALVSTQKIMASLAPIGDVYQAGTLSANPLAMVAGLATLKELTPEFYLKIENQTKKLVSLFTEFFKSRTEFSHLQISHFGSLFWIYPKTENLHRAVDIPTNLAEGFYKLFEDLLGKGIYLAPNAYEVGFMSIAHDDQLLEELKSRLWK